MFAEHLGDAVVGSPHPARPGPLDPGRHRRVGARPPRSPATRPGCRFFDFLSAIDWLPSPFGRYEDSHGRRAVPAADARPVRRRARLRRRRHPLPGAARRSPRPAPTSGVLLKADVPDDDPRVATWIRVYAGADWHEREAREMFGIAFDGHPDLRHIYLPARVRGPPAAQGLPAARPRREAVAGHRRRRAHARRGRRRGRGRRSRRRRRVTGTVTASPSASSSPTSPRRPPTAASTSSSRPRA